MNAAEGDGADLEDSGQPAEPTPLSRVFTSGFAYVGAGSVLRQLQEAQRKYRFSPFDFNFANRSAAELSQAAVFNVGQAFNRDLFAPVNKALLAYMRNLPPYPVLAETVRRAIYPPNLRQITDLDIGDVESVLEDGIPLYYVPKRSTSERIINARTLKDRRAIVGRRFDSIVVDCEEALRQCTNLAYMYELSSLNEAITVIRTGHANAGQALAATVMDTLLWRWGDANQDDWRLVTQKQRVRRGMTPRDMEDLAVRTHLVMMPAYVAHTSFNPKSDPIPQIFNRHATLHRVSFRQYSKRNTAIALMLATSLLIFMDQQY